jgi:hypothetical protein
MRKQIYYSLPAAPSVPAERAAARSRATSSCDALHSRCSCAFRSYSTQYASCCSRTSRSKLPTSRSHIRLYVKLTLVELVAYHCPVRVQFLITIHVIMEVALHAVKTHTRQQTRFAPVSPKSLSLDTQEWPTCPLSPSSHPQNVLHQI